MGGDPIEFLALNRTEKSYKLPKIYPAYAAKFPIEWRPEFLYEKWPQYRPENGTDRIYYITTLWGEPRGRRAAERRREVRHALGDGGGLLLAAERRVACRVVEAVRAHLPAGLAQRRRDLGPRGRLGVDDGRRRHADRPEEAGEAAQAAAVAVVAPARVGHLRRGVEVRLHARSASAGHKDLHQKWVFELGSPLI